MVTEDRDVTTEVWGRDVEETVTLRCVGCAAGIDKASAAGLGRREGTVGV